MKPVTDPSILEQLEPTAGLKPVTDEALLAQLDGRPAKSEKGFLDRALDTAKQVLDPGQPFIKGVAQSDRALINPLRIVDGFTEVARSQREAKANKSVMDGAPPVTGYDEARLIALSNLPRIEADMARRIEQAKLPRLEARTGTITPTGGILDAAANVPGNTLRSIGSTILKAGAIPADIAPALYPQDAAQRLREGAAMLDRRTNAANLGVSDQPLLQTGTRLDNLMPSARDVSQYAPEGVKQLGALALFGPGAILADAGVQGYDRARVDGLSPGMSALAGATSVVTEGVPEAVAGKFAVNALNRVPLRTLMSGDAKAMTEALQQSGKAMGLELSTEQFSALGNFYADRVFADPTATPERLKQDMVDAFKATLIQGPTMIAGGKALQVAATGGAAAADAARSLVRREPTAPGQADYQAALDRVFGRQAAPEPAPAAPPQLDPVRQAQATINRIMGQPPAAPAPAPAPAEADPIGELIGQLQAAAPAAAPAQLEAPAPAPAAPVQATLPEPAAAPAQDDAPILQNRNRSTPTSIAQMQSISQAPDYGRLGFSRDFANGAPVVAGLDLEPDLLGRTDLAVAADGRRIPVQYAVVEADQVLASNNADGTPNADYGRQELDALRAIAGNGRIAGLQAAYRAGNAEGYKAELADDSLHGVSPEAIARMRAPVLVRVMPREAVTRDIGDVSNTVGNLELSAVEQANNDAQRVNLDALSFAADGGVTAEAVRQFVRAMPQAEQGNLIDTNGQPTKQAVDRLNAAVFARAYGNDDLVRLFAQAQDPEARNVLSALAQVAPKMARLAGAGALDIRGVVSQAAEIAVNARREGKTLAKAAAQLDLAADPDVGVILQLFADNARTVAPVVEALGNAADLAYTEATKPAQDMFGEVPRAGRQDIINQLRPQDERASQENLEVPAGREPAQVDAGRSGAEPRAAADPAAAQAGRPAQDGGAQQQAEQVALTAARIRRREDARSVDPRVDSVNAQENYLQELARSQPDQARAVAQAMRANPQRMSDVAGVSPDMVGRYAGIIERQLELQPQTQEQPLLQSYTPAEVEQRLARLEEAERQRQEEERQQRAADRRAQADAERDTFTLTGSDRQADVAAVQGQRDLMDDLGEDDDGPVLMDIPRQPSAAPDDEKRVLQREPGNLQPAEQAAFDEFMAGRSDAERIMRQLEAHKGTPWAKQAMEGIFVRQAMRMLLDGRTPDFQSSLNSGQVSKVRSILQTQGVDGMWRLIEGDGGLMGGAAKPVNNVNSSFINCDPSADCAKYCYATAGNYRYANVIVKSELVTLAVELDPVRAAQRVAQEYKATAEFVANKALRLFDKGDGNDAWLPFIKELNRQGIRVQIFSKVPEFLRQVPPMNLRLLSIDNSNMDMADANPDLPVAFVYTGKDQVDMLAKLAERNQIQVVLPVKLGRSLLDGSEVTDLKKAVPAVKPYLCPIDAGFKPLGKTSQPGTWNCTKCDVNGGVGCFHGNATKVIMDSLEAKPSTQQERARRILELRREINEINAAADGAVAETGRLSPGRTEGLLRDVDALLGELLREYESAGQGQTAAGLGRGIDPQGERAGGPVPGRRVIPIRAANARPADDAGNLQDISRRQAVTDTAEFRAWFGNSQVVDASGRPLVMYHGTHRGGFEVMKPGPNGKAIFMAPTPAEAEKFGARHIVEEGDGNVSVMPVYVKAENPFDYDNEDHVAAVVRELNKSTDRWGQPRGRNMQGDLSRGNWEAIESDLVRQAIQAAGFDSFYVEEAGVKNLGVFAPSQVKSAIGNDGSFDSTDPSILSDMSGLQRDGGMMGRLPEPVRANVLARLKALQRRLDDGRLDQAGYIAEVQALMRQIEDRNQAQAQRSMTKGRERGPDWIKERLIRAKRKGELDGDTVDFALWALEKNPALANDLGISLPGEARAGAAGDYNPASRVMRLFKSTANATTAVHEILHHTERMMPREVQAGIAKAYQRAWDKAYEQGDDTMRGLLQAMLAANAGDKLAYKQVLDAFATGKLNYDQHYQLFNASEFWAVNATDILAGRYQARGSWIAQAKQWLREMLERIKGILGMRSNADVLRGLKAVMEGNGQRLSPAMLQEVSGVASDIPRNDQDNLDLNDPGREPMRARDVLSFDRDAANRRIWRAGRKGYERGMEFAGKYLGALKLADTKPAEFRQMMRRFQADNFNAQQRALEVAESGRELPKELRTLLSDIIEKEVAVGDNTPEGLQELAATIAGAFEQQAQQLIELGMLSEKRLVENYLPRVYRNPLIGKLQSKEQVLAMLTKARMRIRGDRLKSRGLVYEVPPGRVKDMERLGWKLSSMPDGSDIPPALRRAIEQGQPLPPGFSDDQKVVVWRDFTKTEREQMGEVRDAFIRFAMGYVEMQKDLAVGRLFKSIAENERMASRFNPGGWVKVPEKEIPGSGGVQMYGALAGMYVERQVADQLKRAIQDNSAVVQAYDKALSLWKEGKTVWNPVAHGNNVVSNIFMGHFAGLNMADPRVWRNAIREYRNKGELYQEAVENGLLGTEFANTEIQNALMPELREFMSEADVVASRVSKVTEFLKKYPGRPFSWYRENMQKAYEFEDQIFKLMVYIDRRKAGATPGEAIDDAERYFFNYADVPEGIRAVQRVWSPFFSYTYKALPSILHTAATRPDRILLPMALLGGSNWLAYMILAGDDEEEPGMAGTLGAGAAAALGGPLAGPGALLATIDRARRMEKDERRGLPEYMEGRTALGTQKVVRLPINSADGNPYFLDMSRRIPLGDVFDVTNQMGGFPLLQPFMPAHPFLWNIPVAMFANKDTFTGRELVKESDDEWEKATKWGGYLYRQMAPNAPIVPGSYSFNKMMEATAQGFDREIMGYTGFSNQGDPVRPGVVALDVAGVAKVRESNTDRNLQFKRLDITKEMREVQTNMMQLSRRLNNNAITQEQHDRERERQEKKLELLREKMSEAR